MHLANFFRRGPRKQARQYGEEIINQCFAGRSLREFSQESRLLSLLATPSTAKMTRGAAERTEHISAFLVLPLGVKFH